MKEIFGITVLSDKEGVLQDVHWSGSFRIFSDLYSGVIFIRLNFFRPFRKRIPISNWEVREKKDFSSLLNWLKKNVHWKL
ncbi:peptidase M32 [Leptospira santarosai serovar Bananal]|nr:peptidase M32 [Leptospira santarosai serovar Grippotyphosa]ONF78978.1 peptidase M32 [Leptospira santarosai serovar Bananal]